MAEQLATYFVELFKNRIPEELTIFIISLMPILEIRGGMIAAKLLGVKRESLYYFIKKFGFKREDIDADS